MTLAKPNMHHAMGMGMGMGKGNFSQARFHLVEVLPRKDNLKIRYQSIAQPLVYCKDPMLGNEAP